jgi:hypothetical protein
MRGKEGREEDNGFRDEKQIEQSNREGERRG